MPVKKSSKVIEPEIVNPPTSGAARVTEVNTTRREYVAPASTDDLTILEDDAEPELSPIDQFLSQIVSDQQFQLIVERLPNYAKDGKAWPGNGEYLATWQFTDESVDSYLRDVQEAFGGGTYRFVLKYAPGYRDEEGRSIGGRIARSWTARIGAPVKQQVAPDGRTVYVQQQQPVGPAVAPLDPVKAIKEQTSMLREVVSFVHELTPQVAPANPNAPTELTVAMAEQSARMNLIQSLITQPKTDLTERVLMRLVGEGEEKQGSSWIPDLIELIKVGIENLPDIISRFTAAPVTTNGSAPTQTPAPALNAAPAPPVDQRTPSQQAFGRAMGTIVQGMYADDLPSIACAMLDQLLKRYDEWQGSVDKLMSAPAVEVVNELIVSSQLVDAPEETKAHWAKWIEGLQAEWNSGESEEGKSDEH